MKSLFSFPSLRSRYLRAARGPLLLAAGLLLASCGSLVDMGNPDAGTGQRRAYLNDVAANDSLRSALINDGVYFVMQPGKKYSFQVQGGVSGEYLQLYSASGRQYNFWRNAAGTLAGTTQTYTVEDSTATAANYVLARLRTTAGGPGTRPAKVRLLPAAPGLPSVVKVRLVMVHSLIGLETMTARNAFARSFLSNLAATYAQFGIALDTSSESVDADQAGFTADFNGTTVFPGGARIANTVYLYLVQNITIDGKANASGTILGFAPREAFDFSSAEVVLSGENGVNPATIAVTAAHEMGHFLGLRHTTSTLLDQQGDDDLSNVEDGFDSTAVCAGLTKRMANPPPPTLRLRAGHPYCLRIAANNTCPTTCSDRFNLMFPYQCPVDQDSLVNEQRIFIRQNLSIFQR